MPSENIVLMISSDQEKCGIAQYVRAVANELRGLGWRVETGTPPRNKSEGLTLKALSDRASIVHVQYDPAFWKWGKKNVYDNWARSLVSSLVITLHEVYEENPLDFPYSQIRSLLPGGVPLKRLIYRLRHRDFNTEIRLCKRQYHAKAIQVHNQFQKRILEEKGVVGEALRVIPQGVLRRPPVPLRSAPSPWRFGTAGFVGPAVDYALVLQALKGIRAPWEYIIAGGPRLPEHQSFVDGIRALAKEMGIESKIEITGFLDPKSHDNILSGLDLCIAPFKFKSSSASLNRYLAFGLPVVAPDLPLLQDMNHRIPCVATYTSGKSASLQGVLLGLMGDDDLRSRLAGNARSYAQTYSFGNEARQLIDLYQRILQK